MCLLPPSFSFLSCLLGCSFFKFLGGCRPKWAGAEEKEREGWWDLIDFLLSLSLSLSLSLFPDQRTSGHARKEFSLSLSFLSSVGTSTRGRVVFEHPAHSSSSSPLFGLSVTPLYPPSADYFHQSPPPLFLPLFFAAPRLHGRR